MRRLKILLSAYSCDPAKGSESGIGWNVAHSLAKSHNVWVLTRAFNRASIESRHDANCPQGLHVVYHDLPQWVRRVLGVQIYYYLWQATVHGRARALHTRFGFDIAHHITFGRYWSPSPLALLGIPFVWGPVGGGESCPASFARELDFGGWLFEAARNTVRALGERDWRTRCTAAACRVALATTPQTAARLAKLGVKDIRLEGHVALDLRELDSLSSFPAPPDMPVRFLSSGRLLSWKGFHLGLAAFAKANIPGAEYWIVGGGPARSRLEALARSLGISGATHFFGSLPRSEALSKLAASHVLVHPSLHDSGGWVVIEAMAAGKPVICLDCGGPATLVNGETGIVVAAGDPAQAVADMAEAMRRLAQNRDLRASMAAAAQERARTLFTWDRKAEEISRIYHEIIKA